MLKNLLTFFVETDIINKEFSGLFKFALDESANQAFSTAFIHNGNIPFIFGGIAQLARVLGSYPIGRRFESHCRYHVGASFVSLAPIFCKNQSALTPLLLLSAKSHVDYKRGHDASAALPTFCGFKFTTQKWEGISFATS